MSLFFIYNPTIVIFIDRDLRFRTVKGFLNRFVTKFVKSILWSKLRDFRDTCFDNKKV